MLNMEYITLLPRALKVFENDDSEEMSAAVRLLVGIALVIVGEVFSHQCN